MKNSARQLALCLIAITIISTSATSPGWAKKRDGGISFQVFYDNLEPYGRWINDREHGYVWIPDAEPGFQPYATRGHWIMTSYGNTWVSDYPWGWATFHYGRWHFDDFYGWEWIPGDEWGPAWVNWRSGDGYYGWTPMEPGVRINVSINIPLARWIFVPQRYICHPDIYRYYSPRIKNKTIIRSTTVINNVYVYNDHRYVSGPGAREIERVTRGRVPVYQVNNEPRPGYATTRNGSVGMYRPEVDRRNGPESRPRGFDTNTGNRVPDRNVPSNSASPDRVSVSQGSSSSPVETRTPPAVSNRDNQPSNERTETPNRREVFGRSREEMPQQNRTEEKREPVRSMPQRTPQRQENSTQERSGAEQAKPQRQSSGRPERSNGNSSRQDNQKKEEKAKDEPSSGRESQGRQRPGRV